MRILPGWDTPENAKKWEARCFWFGIALFMADAVTGFTASPRLMPIGAACFTLAIIVEVISRFYDRRCERLIATRDSERDSRHKEEIERLESKMDDDLSVTYSELKKEHKKAIEELTRRIEDPTYDPYNRPD